VIATDRFSTTPWLPGSPHPQPPLRRYPTSKHIGKLVLIKPQKKRNKNLTSGKYRTGQLDSTPHSRDFGAAAYQSRSTHMAIITWSASFSVGHPEIDRQHMELFNLMNEMERLLASLPGDYNRLRRLDILERLLDFAARHTKLELQVLQECGCDDDTSHHHWRSHKAFDSSLYSLYRQLLARELVLDSSILATIRHKFFNHVLMEDKELFGQLTTQVRLHPSPGRPLSFPGAAPVSKPRAMPQANRGGDQVTVLFSRYFPEIPA
jgi:hemerythrin-like metal-binding protein